MQSALSSTGPLPITTNLKLVLPRSFRRHALRADEESLNPSDLRPQPSPLERYRRPEFEVVVGARARIWVCLGRRAANFENSNRFVANPSHVIVRGVCIKILILLGVWGVARSLHSAMRVTSACLRLALSGHRTLNPQHTSIKLITPMSSATEHSPRQQNRRKCAQYRAHCRQQ